MKYLLMTAITAMLFHTDTVTAETWTGLYREPNGTFLGIGEFHEFGKAEIFVDYTSGETGGLFQMPDGRGGIGRTIGDSSPPPAHVLDRKGDDRSVDGEPIRPIPVTRHPFEVQNGSVTLAGEVVSTEEKPKGVVIVIHGSGDGPRRAYDVWTNFFLSQRWTVVVYDKRGSGQSTGDWHDADFVALAADARKVVQWVRAQEKFRTLKLGLWGVSQAGWIIPQLAAEGVVDFAIVQAGAITPVDDFIRQTLDSELRAYGFPPEEIAKAQDYYALDWAVSRGVQPFSAIAAAYAKAHADSAEWLLKEPDPTGAPDRKFMAAIAGFDAADYWRKVRIPLVALFGGKDHLVPVEPNRSRLEALLAGPGKQQAQIVTFENDNHLNMIAKTGVRTEYASLNRFDPIYFETLRLFLNRMGGPRD